VQHCLLYYSATNQLIIICYSINHIFKQSTQWRPNQIPELIEILRKIVYAQFLEADRAICGVGDLVLVPTHAKHRQTTGTWQRLTKKQRRKASEACFRLSTISTSTSSDGTVTVPTTPGGGKKPHQVKRSCAARTTTISAKRRCIQHDDDVESDS